MEGVVGEVENKMPVIRQGRSGVIVKYQLSRRLVRPALQRFYSASKFALEGWTESLRHEVRPFGIRAVLVEPRDVRTGFYG
jgi:NAD(P)-dependent dehydrogenase (short-subunit alcohol dehydrogenase family)